MQKLTRKATKRYIIPLLTILVLASGLVVGCGQEASPTLAPTPKVDAGLIKFQQIKTRELNQLNAELAKLQVKIAEKKSEYEQMQNLMAEEEKRLIQRFGHLPYSLDLYSSEYIVTSFRIGGIANQLQQLRAQEQLLLTGKQYLEQDIQESKHRISLKEYYEFKLLQLQNLNTKLTELRIDIDQKTLLRKSTYELQQRYDELLLQRQLLQQDIKQLQELLQRN